MKKEKHVCTSRILMQGFDNIISARAGESCGKNAKYFENENWYCGIHAPSQIAKREEKKLPKFLEWQLDADKKHLGSYFFGGYDRSKINLIEESKAELATLIHKLIEDYLTSKQNH